MATVILPTALDLDAAVPTRPPGYFSFPLPSQAAEFYAKNGYLVVEDALSPAEVAALNADALKICRQEYGPVGGTTPEGSIGTDAEVLSRFLCIHFPHKASALMRDALAHPAVVDVLTRIIGPDVKAMQSMLFIKASGKPGQAWHQDEDFIPTRDNSLCGGWIALDDATTENGCLWVLPGSHKPAVLWPQHQHDDRRFDCTKESVNFPWRDADAVPVEVRAGSVVFFNGYLLHRSLPNRAPAGRYRRALVNHYMSAYSLLPWFGFPAGTPTALADMRDIVMVVGKDPYAYKGTVDLNKPHVRAAGEGGCIPGGAKPSKAAPETVPAPMMGAPMMGAAKG